MLMVGETECRVYGNLLYYLLNFSINLNLLSYKKVYVKKVKKVKPIIKVDKTLEISSQKKISLWPKGIRKDPQYHDSLETQI